MKRNLVILSIIGFLLVVFLWLYANEFEIRTTTEFWIILVEVLVFIAILLLVLFLKTNWGVKTISIIGLSAFMIFGLPRTGLWRFSLNKYVKREKAKYIDLANEIDKISVIDLSYVACIDQEIIARPKLTEEQIEYMIDKLCLMFQKVDCGEVFLNEEQDQYLFVMSRFIDNGYGILYCRNEPDVDQILDRGINGLEITTMTRVESKWYYVSFS